MLNELYLYSAFRVFQLLKALLQHKSAFTHSHTHIHAVQTANLPIGNSYTHTHTPVVQPLGAIWGSVSCTRTLDVLFLDW